MKKETPYIGLLLLAAALWGSSFVASKVSISHGLFPFEIVFYRFFGGTILTWLVFHKQLRHFERSTLRAGLLLGLVTALAFILEICGLTVVPASKASFLTATYIVILPILYCLYYRIRPNFATLLAAALALAGVSILSAASGLGHLSGGDLLLLGAALMYALNSMVVSAAGPECPRIQLSFLQFAVTAVLSGVLTLFQGRCGSYPPPALAAIAFQILFPTVICYIIKNFAMQFVDPVKSTLVLSTESAFCALLSALLLRERISLRTFAGIVLVAVSIVIETLHPIQKPAPAAEDAAEDAVPSES